MGQDHLFNEIDSVLSVKCALREPCMLSAWLCPGQVNRYIQIQINRFRANLSTKYITF